MGWIAGLAIGIVIALGIKSTVTGKRISEMGEVKRVIGLDIPGNARQIPEGYTVSGMISPSSVQIIKRRGIRVVLSAVSPSAQTVDLLRSNGIEWIPVRIGSTFVTRKTSTMCRADTGLIRSSSTAPMGPIDRERSSPTCWRLVTDGPMPTLFIRSSPQRRPTRGGSPWCSLGMG